MYTPDTYMEFFNLDDIRRLPSSLPEQALLKFTRGISSVRVVIFNSLTWKREEVVSVLVASVDVQVIFITILTRLYFYITLLNYFLTFYL